MHAIPETDVLPLKENSIQLIAVMICGAILPNSLQNSHPEKDTSDVKIQSYVSKAKKVNVKLYVQQGAGFMVLAYS